LQLGLAVSLLVHVGLLAWAYLLMLSTPKLDPPGPEPITVALITPSELLRLKQGSETAKELEAKAKDEPKPEVSKKEAEKPNPITAPTPPAEPEPPKEEAKPAPTPPPEPPKAEPPKPDAIAEKLAALPPEPPPGPTPDEIAKKLAEEKQAEEAKRAEEQRKAEEKRKAEEEKKKAEEKRKAEEKKKAEELKKKQDEKKKLAEAKKKAEEKKKKADADRLAALLDKDPTKKGAPLSATPPTTDTDYTGPTAGAREGNDTVLSAREEDLLRGMLMAQLRECWKLPGGGGGIETAVVVLKWRLRTDGSLEGEPSVLGSQPGAVYQIAAEAAIRAVKTCAPYNLPPDMYVAWKTIEWTFDPAEMR
jgi:colicin import membrane protein